MEIRVAALADGANIAAGDKLNVLGVFDTLRSSELPASLPHMVLAMRFRLDHEDRNKTHELVVSALDNHGALAAKATVTLKVGMVEAGGFAHLNQVLNFTDLKFQEPGRYEFRISWDGREKACLDLMVVKQDNPKR